MRIFSHLRLRRRRADWERDMAEEFESHLAMHVADNLRAGMNAEEALRAARLKFGGMESVKEDYRDTANWLVGDKLMMSIRYGFRQIRRNAGFAAVVVGTLALAIGVNSAVFSALDAVILKPLPFPNAKQLCRRLPTQPCTARHGHCTRTTQRLGGDELIVSGDNGLLHSMVRSPGTNSILADFSSGCGAS